MNNASAGNIGSWQAALAIARRDLLEFVRDRRTLFITLLLPMVTYPIVALSSALGLRTALVDIEARQTPTKLTIALSGEGAVAFAVRIREFVNETRGSRTGWPAALECVVESPQDSRAFLDDGAVDLWLEIPKGCAEALDQQETVAIEVHAGSVHPASHHVREQFTALMRSFADGVRRQRMGRAGLPESVLEPLQLTFSQEGSDAARSVDAMPIEMMVPQVAGAILVLLAILTMTGAFYPAIDAIAGEKERGTIETLLIAPCRTQDIVFGKFLAVYAVTLATLAANVISIAMTAAVGLRFLPAGILERIDDMTLGTVVTVLAFMGLAALAAATCLAVTTASKSAKEAQNTLTPVILLVSALAGAALLPGLPAQQHGGLLAAVPFTGQVIVAKAAISGVRTASAGAGVRAAQGKPAIALSLAITLFSSASLAWLLLRATAAMLADEDILFRGPDAAGSAFARPGARTRPTIVQGVVPIVAGLAAVWYLQGFAPDDLLLAIPLQQATAVLLPLGLSLGWQRVNLRQTFRIQWPYPDGQWWHVAVCIIGAALVGSGLFACGAAALLAVKGTHVSAETQLLSSRLLLLLQNHPWWVSWSLMALLPAVCEELLFRGWTLSAFIGKARQRERVVGAVVVQAALFALVHLLPERMPQTLVLGLVLGWITITTGSLLPAIICHVAHNSMPLILIAGMADMTGPPGGMVMLAIGCVAVGMILISWSVRSRSADAKELVSR